MGLVENFAATVNLNKLKTVEAKDSNKLPSCPGVYFIIAKNNDLIYIGIAMDIRQRLIKGHHKYKDFLTFGIDKIKWLEVPEATEVKELLPLEKKLIKRFTPVLNGKDNNSALIAFNHRDIDQDECFSNFTGTVAAGIKQFENEICFKAEQQFRSRIEALEAENAALKELVESLADLQSN